MNKNNAKDYLPLVQALAEGKVIQGVDGGGEWEDLREVYFSQPSYQYRIKPEPLVIYATVTSDGSNLWTASLQENQLIAGRHTDGKVRKFVEVIED